MAIVINGSGTVTGLSVGGLPDGTVDAGTLATNSVDSAELIDGAVDDSHMAAMAASKLTGALPAIDGSNLTGIAGGLTEADQWRLTSNTALGNDTETFLTSNLARATGGGWGKLGTGMSESSGIFTFPSTGIWHIAFTTKVGGAADARYIHHRIYSTTDNSSYGQIAASSYDINQASSYHYGGSHVHTLFDVTSTSTHKVKFSLLSITNSIQVYGGSSDNTTYFTFMKLGDT